MAGKNIKVALQITADLNQARLAIQGLNHDLSRITGGMHDLRTSQTTISRSIADTNAGVQRLSSNFNQQNQAIRQLIATTAAYFSVNKLMNEADGYTSLHNRLKIVTEVQNNAAQSQINLKTALGDTLKIAQSAAADWGGVSSIYDKIYKNSERLNLSQKQVASITETVTKSISNSGSSAQAASAALYQLGQSFDKGSLNGDEFVSISENAGYVMDVLAKGLGVTRAELRQMSTDGKLTTDAMVQAFTNMYDKVNQAYGSTQTTIGGGWTMVSNALKQYVGTTDQGIGATKVLVNALSGVANNFSEIINIIGLAAWGLFTQKLIAQATAMKAQIILAQTNRTALLAEMQATVTATTAEVSRTHALMQLTQWKLADARADMARMSGMQRLTFMQQVVLPLERQLTAATATHTAAQAAQTTATNALAAAKSRLAIAGRAVLGFFGGPLGLLITGLSVASMYLMMRDSSKDAEASLDDQAKTVAELAEEYKKLEVTQQRVLLREVIAQTEELTDAYKEQKNELLGLVDAIRHTSNVSDESKKKAEALFEQYRKGEITAGKLATGINSLKDVSNTLKGSIDKQAVSANKAASELNKKNQVVSAYGGQVSSATILTDSMGESLKTVGANAETSAGQVSLLTKAHKELLESAQNNTFSLQYEIGQRKDGVSPALASANAKTLEKLNADPNSTQTYFRVPDDLARANAQEVAAQKELDAINERQKKREEAITKEKEKQAKLAATQKIISATSNEQTKNMLMVYQALSKAGLPDQMARYFTSEVGREGNFASKYLFGSHSDHNNQAINTGMLSWQKIRSTNLTAFLKSKGVLNEKGGIKQTQAALDAQAEFLVNELFNTKEYSQSKNAVLSGKSYKQLQQTVGNNFVGWDIKGSKLSNKQVSDAIARMDGHYNKLNSLLGTDPTEALAAVNKIIQIGDDFQDIQEKQDQNRISIRASLFTEEERQEQEHQQKLKDIRGAGFSDTELAELTAKENQRYEDVLSKRPEILKRVNDSIEQLNQSFLQSSGRGLEADIQQAAEKYKQLQSDLSTLMLNETDSTKQQQYKSMLVRIDFIVDKEQLTLRFNDAMQRLEQLQSLRQQRQDTLKLQFESGQIAQPQYAQGLKAIDFEMQPQLLKLVDTARDLAAKLDDAFSVAKIENFAASLTQVDLESKKFLPTLDQIQEKIAGGMTDAIMSWVDGTQSASDAFRQFAADFLREIAQMILKQMIFNAVKAASSFMGYADGGLVTGFSTGGYTGAGGKYQEAGIVHKDEFVIRKESTSQAGAKEFLTYFNRYGMAALHNFKGYADGGLVAAPAINVPNIQAPQLTNPTEQIANSTSFSANQQFLLVDDPSRLSDYMRSGEGQETLVVMMSRDPAKFKAALKIGN